MTVTSASAALLDYEQEFINHLQDQESLEFILREGVSQELLISPLSKSIYNFVQHHYTETGKVPSAKVLQTEFKAFQFGPVETTPHYIIDWLRTRYQKNEVGRVLTDVATVADKDPELAMTKLRDKVFEIERTSLSQRHVWKPGDHVLFINRLKEKVREGAFKGVSVGFPEIDYFTGGIKAGNVAYIMARQKRQKTFLTLNAFIKQVLDDEEPYLFTLENTEEEINLRISCMLSGVSWDDAQKGKLKDADYKIFNKVWEDFAQHKFHIEMPPLDERTVNHFTLKADKVDAGPILISQFRYIRGTADWYRSPHDEPAEIAVDLKRAATRPGNERPIIVEAQFNRAGDSMDELADFDGSKVGLTTMIEQSADTLYGIFQNKDMRSNGLLEFGILEARNHDKAAWFVESELVNSTRFALRHGSQH